jgi:hypothetical protein
MNRILTASVLYVVLATHVAFDGVIPLINGWMVKLGMVPFVIAGCLLLAALLIVIWASRLRSLGFAVACIGTFLSAASVLVPLFLDGELPLSDYPYPGSSLFPFVQFVGYLTAAVLLSHGAASSKSGQITRNEAHG